MARPRIHKVDESFFDAVDTEAKAYWLGFLYADGHPAKRALMLGLGRRDGDHVERFKTAIGSAHTVRHSERVSSIAISSTLLSTKVRELRSACHIPEQHSNHFVRGVFDGDGCISKSSRGFFSATVAGGRRLTQRIKALAEDNGIAGGYVYKHSRPNTPTYVLHFTTLNSICAFRDWIYRDATVYLPRKKALFDEAAPLLGRACIACGGMFAPRYADKGAYCSRKCYMRDYYAANRDSKWKQDGVWRA